MGLKAAYRAGLNNRPGWRIRFTYDADLIDALKTAVPSRDRAWFAETKEWWFAEEHEETVLALLPGLEVHLRQPQLL